MDNKKIEFIIDKFNKLKSERTNWDNSWQIISEFVNTKKANFTSTQTDGIFLNNAVFNNKAQQSVKSRASTIKSMIIGDYDFKLEPVNKYLNNNSLIEFFTKATEILKEELKRNDTGFNKSLNQSEEFDATFGTSVLYSDFDKHLNFKCLDLKECYIDEDYTGNVDCLYRIFELNTRQAVQQFGIESLSKNTQQNYKNNNNTKVCILNVITPIQEYKDLFDIKNDFTYISLFIEINENHLINYSGYYEKPFFVHREGQKVGEKYGRGPSFDALPLITQVNVMSKDLILIVNRQADPPLGTYDENQILDTSAGAINRFQVNAVSGAPVFNMINETGRPEVLNQLILDREDKIAQFYGLDRLLDFNDGATQMTATEVEARSKIRNSTLSDLFQTKIDEKYTPLILRSFNLLFIKGLFNELIEQYKQSLKDILNSSEDVFKISYYNQIEREKNTQNNNSILNIWNTAGQIAQMKQDISVFDNLDSDKTINLTKTMSYTNEIFRGQPDIQKMREERAQQQEALLLAQQQAQGGQVGNQ